MALLGPPILWTPQLAMAAERWRTAHGRAIGRWIDAVGELEALCSLASYAFEHPDAKFPELLPAREPLFDASGLCHPLIPPRECVANDIHLSAQRQLLLVSGSNMSGKSTLLRAVGLGAVLAWAGAPVRARVLRLTELQVGASMRVVDSLQDHKSRFYAEISRLRQIVALADNAERPLLFLLDEMLSGTNSHDRRIGAEAVIRSLLERGAIGLVTTHDLALAHIAEEMAPRAANVHFEDQIENGQMRFDYRMRDGVVRRSNAIELMRSVGLPV
jgi:DNA mismatch repair ATPase MutS